jgi:hypothetical protein
VTESAFANAKDGQAFAFFFFACTCLASMIVLSNTLKSSSDYG